MVLIIDLLRQGRIAFIYLYRLSLAKYSFQFLDGVRLEDTRKYPPRGLFLPLCQDKCVWLALDLKVSTHFVNHQLNLELQWLTKKFVVWANFQLLKGICCNLIRLLYRRVEGSGYRESRREGPKLQFSTS